VLISAHMAGDFIGWRAALIDQFIANLDRWRNGQPLCNQVDKQRS
jgi:phosphoglycerate dehydrogenase-like enzyme